MDKTNLALAASGPMGWGALAFRTKGFGLFKRSSQPGLPDISGELANIGALFEQARKASEMNINRQAGEARGLAASNLAGRGIYSSPVSENTFGALERGRLSDLSTAGSQLALGEAETRSKLLEALMGLRFQGQQLQANRSAGRFGAGAGLTTSLLLSLLMRNPAPLAANAGNTDFWNMFRGTGPQPT